MEHTGPSHTKAPEPFPLGGVVGTPLLPTRRHVRPLPTATIHNILDRQPVDLFERLIANDRGEPDPAYGGRIGVVIMFLTAVFIGLLLATGGQL